MNLQLILVLGLLCGCVVLFIANKPRVDVVALLAMVALPLCGVLTLPEALAGFSDPNVVLIAALFIVGMSATALGLAFLATWFFHLPAVKPRLWYFGATCSVAGLAMLVPSL